MLSFVGVVSHFFMLVILVALMQDLVHAAPSSHHQLVKSTFIPPASPSLVVASSSPAGSYDTIERRRHAVATGYGLFDHSSGTSFARKNNELVLASRKAGAHLGASTAKGGKLQVKLLKYVEGTGSIGDIVLVAPAFFENKLKRTKSAILISDEEVQAEKTNKDLLKKAQLDQALDMQKKVQEVNLSFSKKAGPEGHLFGGVGKKDILDELKRKFPVGALDGKQMKIMSVERLDGEEIKGDIKETGSYTSTVSLLAEVSAQFRIDVAASL